MIADFRPRMSRYCGDYTIILLLALIFLGPAVWSGRPLSVHEGRLPQLAREMVWGNGNWLLPTSGGRPWLERPPLPHWITAAAMMMLGRPGSLWSARLPAAIAGTGIACIAAWMSGRWFGAGTRLLAGVVTLSSYELYQYATLAEDDIYLGLVTVACMAMFVHQQWRRDSERLPPEEKGLLRTLLGGRPWSTLAFFLLLGLTNLVKGPLVGAAPIIATGVVSLAWNRDKNAVRHYMWIWGWLIFVALTVAWPLWAMRHYPDVVDNWRFDYLGQSSGGDPDAAHQWDHPWWYYIWMLPLALAPWSWATLIGLAATARRAFRAPGSPQRLLWCWALVGLLVLSVPMRKHHQYLVPIITPWAILSSLGLIRASQWMAATWPARASITRRRLAIIVSVIFGVSAAVSAVIQLFVAGRDEHALAELELLEYARLNVPPGEPVLINADVDSLEFFRLQYNLRHDQQLIHNLSYLLDQNFTRPQWYVLTRASDAHYLASFGIVHLMAEARTTHRDTTPGHNFALFEVTPFSNLHRFPLPPYIGVMQAMGRKHGPWLGEGDIPAPVKDYRT